MKDVTIKIRRDRDGKGWTGTVRVDGEEYARGYARDYSAVLNATFGYAVSVANEAEDVDRG